MADNYLERKMEDFRRGKSVTAPKTAAGPRKGYIQFPFPPRKVMIAGIAPQSALPIIREFSKPGCKVAYISTDKNTGDLFARNEGVRFHWLHNYDAISIEQAFHDTVKAWREIDIIICTASPAPILSRKWEEHLDALPIPRTYKGRLIILPDSGEETAEDIFSLCSAHHQDSIAVNAIQGNISPATSGNQISDPESLAQDIARLCAFLSIPGNECISGNVIVVG